MSLSVGIVGLPNVGKSTLFNALTQSQVPAENYPFCTIDPHLAITNVPDHRMDKLQKIYQSEKKIPATISFVDIIAYFFYLIRFITSYRKRILNIKDENMLELNTN